MLPPIETLPAAPAPAAARHPHSTLPVAAAIGVIVAITVPLFTSRLLLQQIADDGWPIVALVAVSAVLGYGPVVWWCWYVSRRWGSGRMRSDLGVGADWDDGAWAPATWAACFVAQVIAGLLVTTTGIPITSNTEGLSAGAGDRAYVISLLVLAVVAAPVVEELAFRGVMLRGLLSKMPALAAVPVQGVLFGAAHVDPERGMGNIGLVIVLSAVGVVLGGSAYLLRRIVPAMCAHAILNSIALTLVLSGTADRLSDVG